VGETHPSSSTGDRQEHLRQLAYEVGLLLWSELEISVAFGGRSKGREDPPINPEVRRSHVRALFYAFQRQGDSAKIRDLHRSSRGEILEDKGFEKTEKSS
jgi:hypothetical protein